MSRKKIVFIILLILMFAAYRLWFAERRYKPVFDPTPIQSLDVPRVIDSVYDLPFNPSYVIEKKGPEMLKENFPNKKEYILFQYDKSLVYVTLFRNNHDAEKLYESYKKGNSSIFNQGRKDANCFFVKFVEQERADQFGLFLPINRYHTSAGFLKQNLVIYISTDLTYKDDKSLDITLKQVGSVLEKKFSKQVRL